MTVPMQDMRAVLDLFCPMHVMLGPRGEILHMGATFAKLAGGSAAEGRGFLDLFEVLRPRGAETMEALLRLGGQKMSLRLRDDARASFKGILAPVGAGAAINLSFGISIMDGVRDFGLSGSDFAATDLAIEMLYLIEAKSVAMGASRKLNQRLQGAKIAAEEQAFTDTLTGLKNRRAVDHVLARQIERGGAFAVMQIDLDFFKAVNDTYGHPAGDHVLQQVARILVDETRRGDCVARVGGDEFVLIFDGVRGREELASIARRLISRIEEPIAWREGAKLGISASVGIAIGPYAKEKADTALFDRVDKALYAAKHAGRAQFRFADAP
ncbi:GGDEF domain-containing protein [Shimia aestuarii]|uniref:GGDEF domain-containing protein n=1 Tax=Shimia aestuarii TaxID=254406 RepID=UPI001FB56170|nr:GGDEF domain-containing protein [Shimia aestuarii]